MGLFSKTDAEALDLDDMDQVSFEKPFSQTGRKSVSASSPDYGVDKAIELMQELPQKDLDTVVTVVMHTLESMNVDVSAIISDAEQKENRTAERIQFLQQEIKTLGGKIKKHGKEISICQTELEEVSAIKSLLSTSDVPAQKSGKSSATEADLFEDEYADGVALIDEETE